MSRILRCFINADLRKGHAGLTELARESNIDVTTLGQGEYVIFVNAAKDKVKVYASNQVIAYHKHNGRLNLNAIRHIPRVFEGRGMSWDEALRASILEHLNSRGRTLTSF